MFIRRALYGGMFLTALATASWAGVIRDPAMGVEEEVLSDPVSGGIHFTATQNGGGIFGFFNDTGYLIIRLDIDTVALTGLDPEIFQEPLFVCNAGSLITPNPFFLNCSFNYNPENGDLRISFFGVNPLDDDGHDGEAGDQEGIGLAQALIVACPTCDFLPATHDPTIGHFAFNLNDGFAREGDTGGWNDPALFPQGGPTEFDVLVTLAPEPGTWVLFGSALLGAAAVRLRRRR